MAIALPPPVTPQQGDAAQLQAAEKNPQVIEFQDYHLHVFGSDAVPQERLKAAVATTDNLSDAVRAIGYVYYVAGYPATVVSYALADHDLYVRVQPGHVGEVQAPPQLEPYFADLKKGALPLTDAQLEADRSLADAFTERAGEQYNPQFHPVGNGNVVLDIGPPAPGTPQTQIKGEFSNYGNRYSGRYLADAVLRQSFGTGDELQLGGVGGIRGIEKGAQPYWEGDGGWSRVTTWGVWGLQGRYIDYKQKVQDTLFDGRIYYGAGTWLYPLYADFSHRFTIQAKFDYTNDRVNLNATGLEALSEIYYSAEVTPAYVERHQFGGQQFEWQAALTARHALGKSVLTLSPANTASFMLRPSALVRYTPVHDFSFALEGQGQLTHSTVPQQEQFVLGGPASLHAFAPGTGVGDHGGAARLSAEWRGLQGETIDIRPRVLGEYGIAALSRTPGTLQLGDVAGEIDLGFAKWLEGTVSVSKKVFSTGEEHSPNGLAKTFYYFRVAVKF